MSEKENVIDYKLEYLKEKKTRLQNEMAILQMKFAQSQSEFQAVNQQIAEYKEIPSQEQLIKENKKDQETPKPL